MEALGEPERATSPGDLVRRHRRTRADRAARRHRRKRAQPRHRTSLRSGHRCGRRSGRRPSRPPTIRRKRRAREHLLDPHALGRVAIPHGLSIARASEPAKACGAASNADASLQPARRGAGSRGRPRRRARGRTGRRRGGIGGVGGPGLPGVHGGFLPGTRVDVPIRFVCRFTRTVPVRALSRFVPDHGPKTLVRLVSPKTGRRVAPHSSSSSCFPVLEESVSAAPAWVTHRGRGPSVPDTPGASVRRSWRNTTRRWAGGQEVRGDGGHQPTTGRLPPRGAGRAVPGSGSRHEISWGLTCGASLEDSEGHLARLPENGPRP